MASCHISCGSGSPNQTTLGRSILPHLQRGGSSENLDVMLSLKSQTVHLIVIILPCNSWTDLLPALWCNPSTFWVKTWTSLCFSSSAIARCPGFGFAASIFCLLSSYHSQTSFGFS